MSSLGVKRRRRNPPSALAAQPKMDMTALPPLNTQPQTHPPGPLLLPPHQDCCIADSCCDAGVIECMDDQCQRLMDEYCAACLQQETCDVEGCNLECVECCDDTTCSTSHTQTSSSPLMSAEGASTGFPPQFDMPSSQFDLPSSQYDDAYSFHCHWNHCDLSFASIFEFDHHLVYNHIPEAPVAIPQLDLGFQCQWDECQTKAHTEADLVKHVKQDHHPEITKEHHQCLWVNDQGVVCNLCCPSAEALSSHLETEHLGSGKGSYTCNWENCSRNHKPFAQKQKAIRHIRTHTGLKAFHCETCGKSFATQEILLQHTRLHTKTRPYVCSICDKRFTTSSALLVHSRVHSGEKPLECKVCGKRFGESSNLRKHERVHVGEKKFVCEFEGCGKRFLRMDQMKRHLKVHQ